MLERGKTLLGFPLPEFRNREMEHHYLGQEIERTLGYTKPLVLILGMLFLLFAVADFFFAGNQPQFFTIFSLRMLYFALILLLYVRMDHLAHARKLIIWLTVYKILVGIIFLIIFSLYESPNLVIQSLGAFTLILAFHVLPNRWMNVLIVSLGLTISFVLLALWKIPDIVPQELGAVGLYLTLTVAINSIGSYQIQRYKRLESMNTQQLARMSVTDHLTGLYNRKRFNEELDQWMRRARESGFPLSLIFFDVDNLKAINDSHGHLAGDAVLKEVARVARQTVRKGDILARWGGDEFAILLPNTTEQEGKQLAKRLKKTIGDHTDGPMKRATCSSGVVALGTTDDVNTFLHRADEAMYRDKTTTPLKRTLSGAVRPDVTSCEPNHERDQRPSPLRRL